jgi:hypothetical protein
VVLRSSTGEEASGLFRPFPSKPQLSHGVDEPAVAAHDVSITAVYIRVRLLKPVSGMLQDGRFATARFEDQRPHISRPLKAIRLTLKPKMAPLLRH